MALDPLKFAVQITDNATQELNNIKTLVESLKDKSINISVSGNLGELLNLLNGGVDTSKFGNLKESINDALSAVGGLNKAAKESNFADYASQINTAKEAIAALSAAISNVQNTVGSNEGFQKFMISIGEVVTRVDAALKQLNESSNANGGITGSKSIEKAKYELYQFDNLVKQAEQTSRLGKQFSDVDTTGLDKAIEKLMTYKAELQQIADTGKGNNNRGFDKFALQADYKEAVAEVKRLIGETETLESSQRRYNQMLQGTRDLMDRIAKVQDSAKNIGATDKTLGLFGKAYDFKERLQSLSESDKNNAHIIRELAAEYTKLAQSLTRAAKEQEKLNAATEKRQKKDTNDRADQLRREESNLRRVLGAYEEAERLMSRLTSTANKGFSLGLDITNISSAINELDQFIKKMGAFDQTADNHATTELIGNFNILRRSLVEAAKAQDQLNNAKEREKKDAQSESQKQAAVAAKLSADAAKQAQRENEKWAASQAKAGEEANKLGIKIRELQRVEQSGSAVGVDTSKLKAYIRDLETYKAVLESIANGYKGVGHTSDWLSGRQTVSGAESLGNTTRLANEASAAVQKLTNEKKQAAGAANQLTAEQQRLAQALNQTAESARGQSQILSDLKSMAMQYLGVWGGQQFLRNIIEIGGQLEMQRLSIGAILQNQSQANDLFDKIKKLAVQSPFGVVELDQMTKQLTAYGFKYNELFDMTKRLADISAATGTSVDRLALALGHVRSEAALSGYTLRQFSMGNVPLLQKLSEKLGKTTQEIRKMVRSKEISYEDVVGVLKDLTDEGGMFYNMQETISQSVKARFKNVKDAMDIMYGEMAEGGIGEALKDVADALMDVTRNWKDVATVIGTGAAVWGIQRAAIMLNTKALGANSAATLSAIKAHIKREGILLSEAAAYRTLSASELQTLSASRAYNVQTLLRIALGKKLTVEQLRQIVSQKQLRINALALAIQTKKLTIEELSHMVAMGKVSKETAILSIKQAGLKANVQSASIAMIEQTRVLTLGQKAAMAASTAVKTLGAAFKSFAPMLLITGIMEAFQRVDQMKERAEELGKDIMQMSQDNLQSARKMMEETGIQAVQDRNGKQMDVTNVFGAETNPFKTVLIKPEFDHETAQSTIDQWAQFIREYSATPNRMLNNALLDDEDNVRSLQEQYDLLFNSIQEVIQAQAVLANSNYPLVFESAQDITSSGWWDDDIADDAQDYVKARKEYILQVTKLSKDYPSQTKKVIDAARREDAAFAKATEGMSNYNDMLIKLIENRDEYRRGEELLDDILYTPNRNSQMASAYTGAKNAAYQQGVKQSELDNEVNEFIAGIQTAFSGVDMSPAIQQALLKSFKMALEKMGNLPKDLIDKYMKQFADAIGAEMDEAEEKQIKRLADWQKRASKSFEVNHEIKVKTTTITSMDEFAQAVQKDLKEKQEYVNRNQNHIKMLFHIEPQFKVTTKYLNAYIDLLIQEIGKLSASGQTDVANMLMSQLYDELVPFRDALASLEEDKKWLKSEGYPETDPNKDKKKNKSGSKKAYKDEEVEKWKERLKNLKAAYDEYKKLEEEFGPSEALERVKRQFKGLIDEKDIETIEKYREKVVELKNKALDRYASQKLDKSKDYGKQAQQLVRETEKAITDFDVTENKRRSDEYLSKLKLQLDELKKQWETFNKVRTATGNEEIAAHVAGLSQDQASKRDIANSVKANIQDIIKEMGDEVKFPIKFDVNASDKDIENNVKKALGGSEKYREQIKGITEAIKTWRDLERDAMQKSVDAYTQAISKAMDYESQLARINAELAEQNRLIDQNNGLSQEEKDRAKGINQANAGMKALEASDSYKRFFNNIFGETKTELQGMEKVIKTQLNYSLKTGAITAEEYAKKIKAVDDVMKQSEIGNPDAWYNKGIFNTETMDQRYQRKYDEGNEMNQKGADMLQRGIEKGDEAMQKAGKEMMKNGQDMMDGANKGKLAMAIIDKVVHGIDHAIQGTVKAFDYLKEALDALGVESDTMSSAGDYLHTLGEMSSHVTQSWDNYKNGDYVGASVEAIGAVTSVIKGVSQAHDNRLERAINKLREDVKSIEANTELIAKARERTLGYDMGDVRRQMAQQYATKPYNGQGGLLGLVLSRMGGNEQKRSMYEYYSKNSQGTGYQQEYNNLIQQRKDYMEILKDQQDKKKKSNDEIEETKAKIAELDDQIAYFSQDLAKELWSIDIKGWADQLSDALASAFENGENMAKAYRDTVTSIIQQMMQKMMQLAILEPMFERLQKQLFGENGKGGVFDPNNPKGSMSKVTAMIADFFGKGGEGEKAITASMEFMTAFQRGMQNAGLTVLNEASNTLSSNMQGTTEETSGLLAGYVNALRQDVSVNRILLTQFVSQMWPDYIETFASQVTAVQNIDTNVQVIMTMMQMGNGAMYEQIAAMRSRIDNVVMGIDKFSIR